MPRVAFKEENVKKNDYSYPKIKLKKGEIARVVLLEEPWSEFVHNIRKPKLNGGVPEKEMKTRFKDGTQYEDYKYEFVSRPICLGDPAILERDGSDPAHCPVCAEATRSDKFSAPQRRFAFHVVKYETLPGKTEVKLPFQATTLLWSFTDKVFSKLFEYQQEWGDLRQRDLILKCENEPFQTYDISVAAKAEWLADDERKKLIAGLMSKENLAPDLALFCGSKKSETQIGYDIRAVNEAWAVALGQVQQSSTDAALSSVGSGSLNLSEGIDDLLTGTTDAKDADGWALPDSTESAGSFDELVGGGDTLAASVGADDDSSSESSDELDALLNGLK
jgi:hypothetical protein